MKIGDFGDLISTLKRVAFKEACQEHGIPHDIWLMVDCMAEAGCKVEDVLDGMTKFAEKKQFMELAESAGIKTEEGWE